MSFIKMEEITYSTYNLARYIVRQSVVEKGNKEKYKHYDNAKYPSIWKEYI